MRRIYNPIIMTLIFVVGLLALQATAENVFKQTSGVHPRLSTDEIEKIESLYETVPVTQWVDRDGLKPTSYAQWQSQQIAPTTFSSRQISLTGNIRNGVKICVIVNTGLYSDILTSLNQYEADLISEGHTVEIITSSGGTPEDMRIFLQGKYAEGMEGCLLIGDFPIPWYEVMCWDDTYLSEFPCDLY
ncbi:MAG: hypothetical protein GY845_29360, partial [Planctomycetes bacterium]|nr:hypothetical protein [Planctomycetota bacterium]